MRLRPFELVLVVIFGILGVSALFLLNVYKPGQDAEQLALDAVGEVTIWGTIPQEGMNIVLDKLRETDPAYRDVKYRFIDSDQFDDTLTTAIADGDGPDLIFISQEKLIPMRKRIAPYSYDDISLREIKDNYLDGVEIFALSDGLYGKPIAVDPLLMYWNRDLLATEGFLTPPRTWENMVNIVFPKLIKRTHDRTIQQSVVAMGEYDNIENGFAIISALLLQAGSAGVSEDSYGGYTINLQRVSGGTGDPLRLTTDFYTRFSRPSNTLYSWNRSFTSDRQQFTAEQLAFYFGFGSEGRIIQKINPNLNFDVADIPQGETATVRRTYGRFYALSMLNASENKAGAALVLNTLGSEDWSSLIATNSNMVSVFRSVVGRGSTDAFGGVAYAVAPVAYGWLNPTLSKANQIFSQMVLDINENRRQLSDAVDDAAVRLGEAY